MTQQTKQDHSYEALFYKLLRLSLGLTQELPDEISEEAWMWIDQMAVSQSLVGICNQGLKLQSKGSQPPFEIFMQWAAEAESTQGMNKLLYQESARLTQSFAEKGFKTAILKGPANARLYPDKYARQPGDIDIWVEGGKKRVLALLNTQARASYHHVHLAPNEQGVTVEVHFRPSSGNCYPLTNRRLQRWLEKEILSSTMVEEGFYVPPVRFALVMQLAHIQRHFLSGGIGLRQVCDYYWLLRNASPEDLSQVEEQLDRFGLRNAAKALMWVLGEVLHLDKARMIVAPDSRLGLLMLREILEGGNFGQFAERQQHGAIRRFMEGRLRHLRLIRFNFWEVIWQEIFFWRDFIKLIPMRIKYRTLSLRDVPELN